MTDDKNNTGLQGRKTPQLEHTWSFWDFFGAVVVRLGFKRNNYSVTPGLYRSGAPGDTSPVLVTSNYKLTFDIVRRHLKGIDAWLLVLDTKGINVWCAAGKGTFGTAELVKSIKETDLGRVVSHRRLVLPQMGAVGVAAHEVKRASGFSVLYGPVYAKDIPAYLERDMTKTEEMGRVKFTLLQRVVIIPVELRGAWKIAFAFGVIAYGLSLVFPFAGFWFFALFLLGGLLCGTVLFPALLPWLPFSFFSLKAGTLGAVWSLLFIVVSGVPVMLGFGIGLLSTAGAAWTGMQFTGASTFTSQSGTFLEVHRSVPAIAVCAGGGVLLLLISMVLL